MAPIHAGPGTPQNSQVTAQVIKLLGWRAAVQQLGDTHTGPIFIHGKAPLAASRALKRKKIISIPILRPFNRSRADSLNVNENQAHSHRRVMLLLSFQLIQTLSAVDKDDSFSGHQFSFSLAPEATSGSNFTIQDNRGEFLGRFYFVFYSLCFSAHSWELLYHLLCVFRQHSRDLHQKKQI